LDWKMPRDGAIIFRDLVGKLDALTVECDKCGRRGGVTSIGSSNAMAFDAKLFDWSDETTAKQARNLNDQCGARCPAPSKVM
jgi:hypothetical protein